MENQVDYDFLKLLRLRHGVVIYNDILVSLNYAKDKFNLNYKEYNHILYLVFQLLIRIKEYIPDAEDLLEKSDETSPCEEYTTCAKTINEPSIYEKYITCAKKVIEEHGDTISNSSIDLYNEIVELYFDTYESRIDKKLSNAIIREILNMGDINRGSVLRSYYDLLENLNCKRKIEVKKLKNILHYHCYSDYCTIINALIDYFHETEHYDLSLVARFLKEKMDAISIIDENIFTSQEYERVESIRKLGLCGFHSEDIDRWIMDNIICENGLSFKTNLNLFFKTIKDFLKENGVTPIKSKIISFKK